MPERRDGLRRHIYGRRKGKKLRAGQDRLVRELLPTIRVPLSDAPVAAPETWFEPRPQATWLEIGFGGGEHLFARASAHPDIGFIGCEPFINGVAKLLSAISSAGTGNVRIHDGDARDLLEALPASCIDRVFLLYPDPWPKARHHKRRFISPDTLDQLARIMRPGSEILFASDIAGYVRWTLAHMRRHGDFRWKAERPADWRSPPRDWPGTRYEDKALAEGRSPAYLTFERL